MSNAVAVSSVVVYDDAGKPSIMVRIPKFKVSDVIPGGRDVTHPAFVVCGVEVPEIYISKYQNIVANERAYSLPFQRPAVNLDLHRAEALCRNKGRGWHLMSNAEWAAVLLWAKKNGTLPRGNNAFGRNCDCEDEEGICYNGFEVLTGSGPDAWAHDHTRDGIFDLNGNAWEWVSGLRLVDGEIQIVAGNDVAAGRDEWQPITVAGKTLKYSTTRDGLKVTTGKPRGTWGGCSFADLGADVEIPDALKELALFPIDDEVTDYLWAGLEGERAALRGGTWDNGSYARAGFALNLSYLPSNTYSGVGFRAAFAPL